MRCQPLPVQDLFRFVDHDGVQRQVISDDMNDSLRDALGEEITAKDFRTGLRQVLPQWYLLVWNGSTAR